MRFRQKAAYVSLQHTQVFMDNNDAKLAPVNTSGARKMLDEIVAEIGTLGGQQDPTKFQRKTELQTVRNARFELRDTHMKPIARVARMEVGKTPELGQLEWLRMPHQSVDAPTLVIWGREMAKSAQPYTAMFVAHGLSNEFIPELLTAVDNVQKALDVRFHAHARRVGATKAIHAATSRALGALGVIDALVVPKLGNDERLLQEWAVTKRVATRDVAAAVAEPLDPAKVPLAAAGVSAPSGPVTPVVPATPAVSATPAVPAVPAPDAAGAKTPKPSKEAVA